MSNGKPCKDHGIPVNICARCVGANEERERIIALAQRKICFDHLDIGNCEHSVCFGIVELIDGIKGENE